MKHRETNDVITRLSDIPVSVVIRISAYTMLCKCGGHSVSGFKVTLCAPHPVPEGRKKRGLHRGTLG